MGGGGAKNGGKGSGLRDLKTMPEYSHSFYWTPFVMIGDCRQV